MNRSDPRKQSFYLPGDLLDEIVQESVRLDRSLSWIIQQAWRVAREKIRKLPKQELA